MSEERRATDPGAHLAGSARGGGCRERVADCEPPDGGAVGQHAVGDPDEHRRGGALCGRDGLAVGAARQSPVSRRDSSQSRRGWEFPCTGFAAGRHETGRAPTRVASTGMEYYRRELERRRDHLRNAWVWHGPLLLACFMLIAIGRGPCVSGNGAAVECAAAGSPATRLDRVRFSTAATPGEGAAGGDRRAGRETIRAVKCRELFGRAAVYTRKERTMRTFFSIMLLGAMALVAAPDANITGKWSGSFNITRPDGETKDSTAVLLLKQTGSEITGSVGPNEEEQHPVTKGNIEGDKLTLEARTRAVRFSSSLFSRPTGSPGRRT